jgi:hypothetical protein
MTMIDDVISSTYAEKDTYREVFIWERFSNGTDEKIISYFFKEDDFVR